MSLNKWFDWRLAWTFNILTRPLIESILWNKIMLKKGPGTSHLTKQKKELMEIYCCSSYPTLECHASKGDDFPFVSCKFAFFWVTRTSQVWWPWNPHGPPKKKVDQHQQMMPPTNWWSKSLLSTGVLKNLWPNFPIIPKPEYLTHHHQSPSPVWSLDFAQKY